VSSFGRTTPEYWECICADDYIKHKSKNRCGRCGVNRFRDVRPDALVMEVIKFGYVEQEELEYVPA
jgi:hypothetical protein